jgi:hypothetical protein
MKVTKISEHYRVEVGTYDKYIVERSYMLDGSSKLLIWTEGALRALEVPDHIVSPDKAIEWFKTEGMEDVYF